MGADRADAGAAGLLGLIMIGRAGLAPDAINAARQVGGVIGVALFGALVSGGPVIPGLRIALAIAGGAFLTAGALTVAIARTDWFSH
ncbi:MAG TPA: hypothetical protein VFO16_15295 [Pseudonocardiaceae bacterium]|nr:hypothetical protein [Pseudonocardiaceae bacterium]